MAEEKQTGGGPLPPASLDLAAMFQVSRLLGGFGLRNRFQARGDLKASLAKPPL
jgi:hypothetical protein